MDRPDNLGIHELGARLRDGDGHAPVGLRRAAYDATAPDARIRGLVEKVAHDAASVTDDDLEAARTAGLTEDQVWEVIVCAAVGESTREYDAGLTALQEALDRRPDPGRSS